MFFTIYHNHFFHFFIKLRYRKPLLPLSMNHCSLTLFRLCREEAADYLKNPVTRDAGRMLKGSWQKKTGEEMNKRPSSEEKGKATKGRPPKNSKEGPSPAKQARHSTSKDQLTHSQQQHSRSGLASGPKEKPFKIPKRADPFPQLEEEDNSEQGKELFL